MIKKDNNDKNNPTQCNCDFRWGSSSDRGLANEWKAPKRYSGYICIKCDSGRTGFILYHPTWGYEIFATEHLDNKIFLINLIIISPCYERPFIKFYFFKNC